METSKTFKSLILWQKAHQLVLSIYKTTKSFPKEEIYALTNQIRRAAVSVPANIVEGYKRKTKPSKLNYLDIAEGSLEEVKYFIILSEDLEYMTRNEAEKLMSLAEEVGKILNGYYSSVKNSK